MEKYENPTSYINIRDEKEFKLWIKFIISVEKKGGRIDKPINILWESVRHELRKKQLKRF